LLYLPPSSPDLNPIEHDRAWLKNKLSYLWRYVANFYDRRSIADCHLKVEKWKIEKEIPFSFCRRGILVNIWTLCFGHCFVFTSTYRRPGLYLCGFEIGVADRA
jgi:hypothetical protein